LPLSPILIPSHLNPYHFLFFLPSFPTLALYTSLFSSPLDKRGRVNDGERAKVGKRGRGEEKREV
jgi:hypothetical protein